MQSDLIEQIFTPFIEQSSHLFNFCEKGFRNELIVSMQCLAFHPGEPVVEYGHHFKHYMLVSRGRVELCTVDNIKFLALPKGFLFGEYQLIENIKSNINFKAPGRFQYQLAEDTEKQANINNNIALSVMAVDKDIFLQLMDLYPNTAAHIREWACIKREIYIHYMTMAKQISQNFHLSGIPLSMDESDNDSQSVS